MPRGSNSKSTGKQKRQAPHIEAAGMRRGHSSRRAAQIGHATVDKQDPGGKKSGGGRGKAARRSTSRAGGRARGGGRSGSRSAHPRARRASQRT